jgi:hypothetical protein
LSLQRCWRNPFSINSDTDISEDDDDAPKFASNYKIAQFISSCTVILKPAINSKAKAKAEKSDKDDVKGEVFYMEDRLNEGVSEGQQYKTYLS